MNPFEPKYERKFLSGTILLLAMIFLLLLGLVSSTLMRTALLETHMAGNNQFREEALQRARGVATDLALASEHFALESEVGTVRCVSGVSLESCDKSDLPLLATALSSDGVQVDYRVERQAPRILHSLPLREAQSVVSSAGRSAVALYEIEVTVDGNGAGLGSARLVRGVAVRLPLGLGN